jgi:REP element-mobilizing transposase RayT
MSYFQIYYHIVFSTRNRLPVLHKDRRKDLYNYLWGILKNKKCHLYRMGGVEDHLHILTSLPSTERLAYLVRDMKTASHSWIKSSGIFPGFPGWQGEYGAFTKSHSHCEEVVQYIKNQEVHHQKESFLDEFKRLLREEGIEFDENYLL